MNCQRTVPKLTSLVVGIGFWVALVFVQLGCKSPPPPPPPPPQVVAPAPVPEVRIDDIPADAPPAVRGHLIKLREMRDLGQITDGDYQSRKALLLGR